MGAFDIMAAKAKLEALTEAAEAPWESMCADADNHRDMFEAAHELENTIGLPYTHPADVMKRVRILAKHGFGINDPFAANPKVARERGWPMFPLVHRATEGSADVMGALLQNGADPKLKFDGFHGVTPIGYMASLVAFPDLDMIKLLLGAGADVNDPSANGDTLLGKVIKDLARKLERDRKSEAEAWELYQKAINSKSEGRREAARPRLINMLGYDPGDSPPDRAARTAFNEDDHEIVKYLKSAGAE